MTYSSVFGGQLIYPAQLTLLDLQTSVDVDLVWPLAAQPDGDVVADIVMVTPGAAGVEITMPDARNGSQGVSILFHNIGADTFSVLDNGGNTIVTVASGEAWQIYLSDNSTVNGTWQTFEFGAGTSSATAASLAGFGLKAITTTLNVKMEPTATSSSPMTPGASDRAGILRWTGGVGALTLPDPAVVGSDWFMYFRNSGTGSVTATPTSGNINAAASLVFTPGDSAIIFTDGTDFYTVGFGQSLSGLFDYTSVNVAGTGDYTLSAGELNRIAYRFTGTLTGNRNVIVPNDVQQYWVDNQTSGSFSLTVKTSAGTGIVIPQGLSTLVYSDGVNVVGAVTPIIPATVQGDIVYASATNTLGVLAKDANATRYISNQGASNDPSWEQVNLANGVTGRLPFANLVEGSALSVAGVPGNVVGDFESIVGTANQVLRVNAAGNALGFGQLNLASSAAVTGVLAVTNGGTGLATVAQGDILYASAANTLSALAKSAVATRYLSNTGADNNPAWAQVDLTNGVTGVIPNANLMTSDTGITPTWGGFSVDPTQTFSWFKIGDLIVLYPDGDVTGTSNAITMTWAAGSLPVAIRPASTRRAFSNLVDNGQQLGGGALFMADGSVEFFLMNVSGGTTMFPDEDIFTNSGDKGMTGSVSWMYRP